MEELDGVRFRVKISVLEYLQFLVLTSGDEMLVEVDGEDWSLVHFDGLRAAGSTVYIESAIGATTD